MTIVIILGVLFFIVLLVTKGASDYEEQKDALLKQQKAKEESRKAFMAEHERKEQERINEDIKIREELIAKYEDYQELELEVRGIFARTEKARELVPTLEIFDTISLRKEPSNMYDEFAVKVIAQRCHVGYIPREESSFVTELIDEKRIKKVICSSAGEEYTDKYGFNPYMYITIFYT